jgi:hypothetical protein
MDGSEFCRADKSILFIWEPPGNIEGRLAGRQVTPRFRHLVNQQFNTVQIIMSNRFNPNIRYMDSCGSPPRNRCGGVEKAKI